MEKAEIQFRLKDVKNLKDFAGLLNDIKQDEFGNNKYKITEQQLLHFANYKIVPNRYKTFHIRKKNGKLREINAPCYQLSILLYIINILFKAIYTPSPAAMGFTEERSVVSNAMVHTCHHYVFNIDLEDFFPSIPQARVWARIQLKPFNFPQCVANVVAGLCCHINAEGTQCVLPQGASTSPLLTNAICDTLDRRMMGLAKRFGLHYTRYADDMSFSSMHNVYKENGKFRTELKRIIEDQGFKMNDSKTRLSKDDERQEVTGITVNNRVNLTRKYIKYLRFMLHLWEAEGYGKAYCTFYKFYKHDKGYIKKGEPIMENVIGGKLNYMRMVKGANNSTYQKLLARFNNLQGVVFVDEETDEKETYTYACSYSLKDFEKMFDTKISLETSPKKKLVGKCKIGNVDKTLAISKNTQKILHEHPEGLPVGFRVESKELESCFVSLCRAKGKNFWLITKNEMKRSRCLSVLNAKIDIDKLLDIWEKDGIKEAAKALDFAISYDCPILGQDEKKEKESAKTKMYGTKKKVANTNNLKELGLDESALVSLHNEIRNIKLEEESAIKFNLFGAPATKIHQKEETMKKGSIRLRLADPRIPESRISEPPGPTTIEPKIPSLQVHTPNVPDASFDKKLGSSGVDRSNASKQVVGKELDDIHEETEI